MTTIDDPVEFIFKLMTESDIKSLPDKRERLNPGEVGKTSFCIVVGTKYGDVKLSPHIGINSGVECKIPPDIYTFKSLLPVNHYRISLDEISQITGYDPDKLTKSFLNIGEQVEDLPE